MMRLQVKIRFECLAGRYISRYALRCLEPLGATLHHLALLDIGLRLVPEVAEAISGMPHLQVCIWTAA